MTAAGAVALELPGSTAHISRPVCVRPLSVFRCARGSALVQRRVESITLDDLQFTRDELSALLAARGIAASDDYIERLSTLCGGWVAGALLAAGGLWSGNMAPRVGDELKRFVSS